MTVTVAPDEEVSKVVLEGKTFSFNYSALPVFPAAMELQDGPRVPCGAA